ncbi:hypothetical protein QBC39DRAFT_397173 [Podospora conica]|nr:hypothetical protein QBC39DRAFT_397173 [Schizothecium conicum]
MERNSRDQTCQATLFRRLGSLPPSIALPDPTLGTSTIIQPCKMKGLNPRKSPQRCSPRVIGQSWASRTKTEWSWDALRWLSTATTPVLMSDLMLDLMIQEKEWKDWPAMPYLLMDHNDDEEKSPSTKQMLNISQLPTASWARLLDFTGLAALSRGMTLHQSAMDTLPSDIPAVPAHAQVSLLVAALAAAGAHTLTTTPSSPYPLLIGDGFQLTFHAHPTLGTVASFLLHPTFQRKPLIPRPPRPLLTTISAILHSRADLRHHTTLPQNRPFDAPAVRLEQWQTDTPYHALSPSVPFPELRRLSHPDHTSYPPVFHPPGPHEPHTCRHVAQRTDSHGLHWLLYASLPRCIPAVFPVALSLRGGGDALGALALAAGRGFWLGTCVDPGAHWGRGGWKVVCFGSGERSVFPGCVEAQDVERVYAVSAGTEGVGLLTCESRVRLVLEGLDADLERKGMAVIGEVLEQSRVVVREGWGAFREWFDELDGGRRRYFRGLVGVQAGMVGRWLGGEQVWSGGRRKVLNEGEILRKRCEMLFDGLMVLGAGPGEGIGGGQRTDWGREGVVGRFAGALGAMEGVLGVFEGLVGGVGDASGDDEVERCMAQLKGHKHRRRLEDLIGRPDPSVPNTGRSMLEYIKRQLGVARGIVDRARSVRWRQDSFWGAVLGEGSDISEEEPEPADQPATDMVIWKAVLMGMLFWTAPDSSEVLTSGVWESVVPVL